MKFSTSRFLAFLLGFLAINQTHLPAHAAAAQLRAGSPLLSNLPVDFTEVYVSATNALIGTSTNNGGGKYSGQLNWSSNPQNITVRSTQGGVASRAVAAK